MYYVVCKDCSWVLENIESLTFCIHYLLAYLCDLYIMLLKLEKHKIFYHLLLAIDTFCVSKVCMECIETS